MGKIAVLGVSNLERVYRALKAKSEERRTGLNSGLSPALEAYFGRLERWHSVLRSAEAHDSMSLLEARELIKDFFAALELTGANYALPGQRLVRVLSSILKQLNLPELIPLLGSFVDFRNEKGESRVVGKWQSTDDWYEDLRREK